MIRGGGRGGGGGGRGGAILRAVGRAVTRARVATATVSSTAPRQPLSSSSSSSSSSSCSAPTSPILAHKHVSSSSSNPLSLSSPFFFDNKKLPNVDDDDAAEEWVSVDGDYGRFFLGAVPSQNEVEDAVSALQNVFGPASPDQVSSDGSETDWAEPSLFPYNLTDLQANGFDRVYYAFHLLKTDPHVQRMVKSLSTDKTVWDAVLNNDVVREIRELFSADEEEQALQNLDETCDSDSFTTVVMRIFNTAKVIFFEIIGKMTKIVSELFQSTDHRTNVGGLDTFNDRLQTSFVLSIMVLLIVVLNRGQAKA